MAQNSYQIVLGQPYYYNDRKDKIINYCVLPFDGPYSWVIQNTPDENNYHVSLVETSTLRYFAAKLKSQYSHITAVQVDPFIEIKTIRIDDYKINHYNPYFEHKVHFEAVMPGKTGRHTHQSISLPLLHYLSDLTDCDMTLKWGAEEKAGFIRTNILSINISLYLSNNKITQTYFQSYYDPASVTLLLKKGKVNPTEIFDELFSKFPWDERDTASLTKIEVTAPVKGHLERLQTEQPHLFNYLSFLHDKKSKGKTTNNQLLAAFYKHVGDDYAAFLAGITHSYTSYPKIVNDWKESTTRKAVQFLPGVSDKLIEKKAQVQWQFAQSARSKADLLGISAERHPTLLSIIEANEINFSLFHQAGKEDNLINTEFDLIETALTQPGWKDNVVAIMKSAQSRSTYSKRVTNYFSFILYVLPRYLNRNAPLKPKGKSKKKRSWVCIPKFVNSQWELEMKDEDTTEGTTKRRSALTPIADSDEGTVHVPYCSMAITGAFTTWCYSDLYTVVEQGQEDPISTIGGSYPYDVAEKLNGRDDYGLCFYTLTGTSRNQGYPTFLIIFERTTAHGTRVHFHRVHPCRARGPKGTETPPHKLIEECYRYMAGNITSYEIAHQQGDLLLIECDGPGKAVDSAIDVFGFENHKFVSKSDTPVQLVKATGKTRGNLLGYLNSDKGFSMPHPEHEGIEDIKPGWFKLLRCKSYENNPTGVWSLNID